MKEENIKIWAGRATSEILPAISRLFAELGVTKPRDLLEWQYIQPSGGAYVALAHDEKGPVDGAVALYAALPVKFQAQGKTLLGVQSFDTFTSAPCRGRGLFPRLAQVVYGLAVADGCSLVYGFPNDSSFPGFKRKLGWQMLDPLPMRVRPIGTRFLRVKLGFRTPQILRNAFSSLSASVRRIIDLPEDIDVLVDEWTTPGYVGVRRDTVYLKWRLHRPGASYVIYEWRSSAGKIEAFGVSELRLKHGCSLGYIMELMHSPANRHAGRSVLQAMIRDFYHREADLVLAWSFPSKNERNIFTGSGFLPFPPSLRPISLHFGYRILDKSSLLRSLDRTEWYLSYLDSDTV
jgi:hypothetical protein